MENNDNVITGPAAKVLTRMHKSARNDWRYIPKLLPGIAWGLLTRKTLMKTITPAQLRNLYIPVSKEEGEFLYITARALRARKIVEFGTSFGMSAIYLGAAVRDNGGGTVITSEIEPNKCRVAHANLREAKLTDFVQIREGDALMTLSDIQGPIDMVFLDGWKDLYLPVFELLKSKLKSGAVVMADNVNLRDAKSFVNAVRAADNGFVSTSLFGGTLEYSLCIKGQLDA